jgi:tRNA threonylcarbamoyladenosine biosynthesis protein TsaE
MDQFRINDLQSIDQVAVNFLKSCPDFRVVALRGAMGSGKTTFIKAVCKAMGVTDTVNSPSFAIVNEYATPADEKIFHFDFYRLKKSEEAYDMGYEEYLYSGHYCFIEWPEKIEELLPEHRLELQIEEINDGIRLLTITKHK